MYPRPNAYNLPAQQAAFAQFQQPQAPARWMFKDARGVWKPFGENENKQLEEGYRFWISEGRSQRTSTLTIQNTRYDFPRMVFFHPNKPNKTTDMQRSEDDAVLMFAEVAAEQKQVLQSQKNNVVASIKAEKKAIEPEVTPVLFLPTEGESKDTIQATATITRVAKMMYFRKRSKYKAALSNKLMLHMQADESFDLSYSEITNVDYCKERQFAFEVTTRVPRTRRHIMACNSAHELKSWLDAYVNVGSACFPSRLGLDNVMRTNPREFPPLSPCFGHHAYLERKEGTFSRSWKRRFARIIPDVYGFPLLNLYVNHETTKYHKTIPLADKSKILASALVGKNPQEFTLRVGSKSYEFRCPTPADAGHWVSVIENIKRTGSAWANRPIFYQQGGVHKVSGSVMKGWSERFVVVGEYNLLEVEYNDKAIQIPLFCAMMHQATYIPEYTYLVGVTTAPPMNQTFMFAFNDQVSMVGFMNLLQQHGVLLQSVNPPWDSAKFSPRWIIPKESFLRPQGYLRELIPPKKYKKHFCRLARVQHCQNQQLANRTDAEFVMGYYSHHYDRKPHHEYPITSATTINERPSTPPGAKIFGEDLACCLGVDFTGSGTERFLRAPSIHSKQAWVISLQACVHAAQRNESKRSLELKEKRQTELAKQLSGDAATLNAVSASSGIIVGNGDAKVQYLPSSANSGAYVSAYAPSPDAVAASPASDNNRPFAGAYAMPGNNQYAPAPADDPFELGGSPASGGTSAPNAPPLSINAAQANQYKPEASGNTLAPSAPAGGAMDSPLPHSPLPTHNADVDSEEDKDDEDGKFCVVCQDAKPNHIIMPCFHLCLCQDCSSLYDVASGRPCPMCRGDIAQVKRVYF